jgi:hypothetical protein
MFGEPEGTTIPVFTTDMPIGLSDDHIIQRTGIVWSGAQTDMRSAYDALVGRAVQAGYNAVVGLRFVAAPAVEAHPRWDCYGTGIGW